MSRPGDDLEAASRGISDDMSAAAIARRIDIVGQLFRLWRTLRQAQRVEDVGRGDAVAEPRPSGGLPPAR